MKKKTLRQDKAYLEFFKFTLAFIDWIEGRPLTGLEFFFRDLVKREVIHPIAVAARHIGKINWCLLGDEDTRLYHSFASTRMRNNNIKNIKVDGVPT